MGDSCRIGCSDQLRDRATRSGAIFPKYLNGRRHCLSRGDRDDITGSASAATVSSRSNGGGCGDATSSAPADPSSTATIAAGTGVAM